MFKLICRDSQGAFLTFPLLDRETVIGSLPACNLSLIAEGVADRNALIRTSLDGIFIEALEGSRIMVDEKPLEGAQRLTGKETIQIGELLFKVYAADDDDEAKYRPDFWFPTDDSAGEAEDDSEQQQTQRIDVSKIREQFAAGVDLKQTLKSLAEKEDEQAKPSPSTKGEKADKDSPILIHLHDDGSREEYPLAGFETSIGRSPRNDIVLQDSSVSRIHARILKEGKGYRILDLDSVNGTYVNGMSTFHSKIKSGDYIRIGDLKMIFYDPSQPVRIPLPHELKESHRSRLFILTNYWADTIGLLILLATIGGLLFYLAAKSRGTVEVEQTEIPGKHLSRVKLEQEIIQSGYAKAVEYISKKQWADARLELLKVIALDGDFKDAQQLFQLCRQNLMSSSTDALRKQAAESESRQESSAYEGEAKGEEQIQADIEVAKLLYIDGFTSDAIEKLKNILAANSETDEAATVKEILAKVQSAHESYLAGLKDFAGGDYEKARKQWEQVSKVESEMNLPRESFYSINIKKYLITF